MSCGSRSTPTIPGAVFLGAALAHTGVAAPVVHPDQVVLMRIDADERREQDDNNRPVA